MSQIDQQSTENLAVSLFWIFFYNSKHRSWLFCGLPIFAFLIFRQTEPKTTSNEVDKENSSQSITEKEVLPKKDAQPLQESEQKENAPFDLRSALQAKLADANLST